MWSPASSTDRLLRVWLAQIVLCMCVILIKHCLLSFVIPYYRPDGLKKAYVRLAPDYDALDVANKVC